MRIAIGPLVVLSAGLAPAQQSSSFKLDEHVFNAGGDPHQGQVLTSARFRITLDAIGEGLVGTGLSSPSFRSNGGFIGAYPPPGEVAALSFLDDDTLEWSPEPSVGSYNVYRDPMTDLPGTHGDCLAGEVGGTAYAEAADPSPGAGFFYLVTAENRLSEEGTRGVQSDGSSRSTLNACP